MCRTWPRRSGLSCPTNSRTHHMRPFPSARSHRSRMLGGWVYHLANFGNLGRRKSTDLRMLLDDRLVLGEINAEGLVVGYIALNPLDFRTELPQRLIGLRCRTTKLLPIERSGARNVAFDNELAQGHGFLLGFFRMLRSATFSMRFGDSQHSRARQTPLRHVPAAYSSKPTR